MSGFTKVKDLTKSHGNVKEKIVNTVNPQITPPPLRISSLFWISAPPVLSANISNKLSSPKFEIQVSWVLIQWFTVCWSKSNQTLIMNKEDSRNKQKLNSNHFLTESLKGASKIGVFIANIVLECALICDVKM